MSKSRFKVGEVYWMPVRINKFFTSFVIVLSETNDHGMHIVLTDSGKACFWTLSAIREQVGK